MVEEKNRRSLVARLEGGAVVVMCDVLLLLLLLMMVLFTSGLCSTMRQARSMGASIK